MSRRTSSEPRRGARFPTRAGCGALLLALAGCAQPAARIDLCARAEGPTLAEALTGGRLELALDDGEPSPRIVSVAASGESMVSLDVTARATSVTVTGIDARGAVVAEGAAPLDGAGGCVCLAAVAEPGAGACAGIGCTVTAGACLFHDGAGAPVGPLGTLAVAGGFFVDATEVTRAAYARFLDDGAPRPTPPPGCEGDSLAPSSGWPGAAADGDLPVAFVDWCDAAVYCAWARKRLCGRIGGGALDPASFSDPSRSQWQSACSAGGTRAYPYGSSYDGSACDGADLAVGSALPVASLAGCVAPGGLADLSGDLAEWEDACDGAGCRLRGGSFLDDAAHLACAADAGQPPATRTAAIGFRCCADGR
jgi:hypothetical protein